VERGRKATISYLRDGKKYTTKIAVEAAPAEEEVVYAEDGDVIDESADFSAFDGASFSEIPANLDPQGGDEGVLITRVSRGSDAYEAGLRKGDIIRAVNNMQIADLEDFKSAIEGRKKAVALTVQRGRTQIFIAVK
jgi:C-terminal processing protease CtpA/Prc